MQFELVTLKQVQIGGLQKTGLQHKIGSNNYFFGVYAVARLYSAYAYYRYIIYTYIIYLYPSVFLVQLSQVALRIC